MSCVAAFYRSTDNVTEESKLETFGKALELGINFIDTAWIYQNFETGEKNEELVGKALKKYGREKFVVATKFGLKYSAAGREITGKPADVRQQCEESLQRLGTDYIDLYYMHRMDPKTPIEETMRCLLELKAEGKIKYVGLSECTPSELERAHAVMPISAIQMEWSLQTRDIEEAVVPTARRCSLLYNSCAESRTPCAVSFVDSPATVPTHLNERNFISTLDKFHRLTHRRGRFPSVVHVPRRRGTQLRHGADGASTRRLGVGIVAYSPLGRGFLSRTFTARADLDPADWRTKMPRFSDDNFDANAAAAAALVPAAPPRPSVSLSRSRLSRPRPHTVPAPPATGRRRRPA